MLVQNDLETSLGSESRLPCLLWSSCKGSALFQLQLFHQAGVGILPTLFRAFILPVNNQQSRTCVQHMSSDSYLRIVRGLKAQQIPESVGTGVKISLHSNSLPAHLHLSSMRLEVDPAGAPHLHCKARGEATVGTRAHTHTHTRGR